MSTLQNIVDWVNTTKLKRTDLAAETLEAAKDFYLTLCTKVPFDQLCVTSAELPVSTTTTTHDLSTITPALAGIVSIRFTYGVSTQVARAIRRNVRQFDQLNPTRTGRPRFYGRWGTTIEFDQLANASNYTYRVRYWKYPTITDGTTVIATPAEWDELIRWETLYRVYTFLDQEEKAMALVMGPQLPAGQGGTHKRPMQEVGIIPRLWNELLETTSAREFTDEDFGINPRVRNYGGLR